MTAVSEFEQLHQLVDQLTPQQARHLRAVAEDLVRLPGAEPAKEPVKTESRRGQRRLSFVGIGDSGRGDLAENADRYLADGFGRSDR